MTLQKEIESTRKDIYTTSYSMSVGELMSLYESGEIELHPEFQRFFRWDLNQKSRFIESILLGIPIPPIFVSQRKDGKWDIIDGMQRLSTIFQLAGILKDEAGKQVKPEPLIGARYLSSLGGKIWSNWENNHKSTDVLSPAQKLLIRRAKIDVNIILMESDPETKYELFQRINTGGSHLSAQEIRNCILAMIDLDYYRWLRDLARHESFMETTSLTDKAIEEQYDLELALRFVILRRISINEIKNLRDVGEFLTDKMAAAAKTTKNRKVEERAFKKTFDILACLDSSPFRRYDIGKSRFLGGFLISAFEVVSLGIGYNIQNYTEDRSSERMNNIKKLWKDSNFKSSSGAGIAASQRLPRTLPLGRKFFA
jgi:uncharacterized protein with ParB-like and HNH nuclease domain